MSDRVAVFNDGVIQQIDAPDVLYTNNLKIALLRSSSVKTTR